MNDEEGKGEKYKAAWGVHYAVSNIQCVVDIKRNTIGIGTSVVGYHEYNGTYSMCRDTRGGGQYMQYE